MGNAGLPATGGGSTQQEACPQLPDAGPPDQMEQQEPASGGVHDTKWTAEEKEWKQKVAAVRRVAPRERKRALEKARRVGEGPVRQSRSARIHGSVNGECVGCAAAELYEYYNYKTCRVVIAVQRAW